MRRHAPVAFFVVVITVCALAGNTDTPTRVHGPLQRNERWRAENGPYIIEGDLVIPEGLKLTITPGTRVYVAVPESYETAITQRDRLDSLFTAIKVYGTLSCIGSRNERIRILPLYANRRRATWYGIVLHKSYSEMTDIAFTDIVGAAYGISVRECSPVVRNCVFEYNKVGIHCHVKGNVYAFNNVLTRNFVCAIRIKTSNPTFYNNIVYSNYNAGVWGDNVSQITFAYNCVFENMDGNVTGCDPRFGMAVRTNTHGDSIDFAHNIYTDPVFKGTLTAHRARQKDPMKETPPHTVADTTLLRMLRHDTTTPDAPDSDSTGSSSGRFVLSAHSPCIDAGNPKNLFKDEDGSRNDMGIHGAREYIDIP
jgi:hypothetical protein